MAIPTSYTEQTLADYMVTVTEQVSAAIGLDFASFGEAINDTLIAYGESDIADATNIKKLRALAKVEAWRRCVEALAARYDKSRNDGQSVIYDKENQLFTNAQKQLELAEIYASNLGYVSDSSPYNTITVAKLQFDDVYSLDAQVDEAVY